MSSALDITYKTLNVIFLLFFGVESAAQKRETSVGSMRPKPQKTWV